MEALQLIGLALACRLDGGFSPAIQSALQSTFQSYQPRVVAFNGGGATQNAVRWVGTEGDMCVLFPFFSPTNLASLALHTVLLLGAAAKRMQFCHRGACCSAGARHGEMVFGARTAATGLVRAWLPTPLLVSSTLGRTVRNTNKDISLASRASQKFCGKMHRLLPAQVVEAALQLGKRWTQCATPGTQQDLITHCNRVTHGFMSRVRRCARCRSLSRLTTTAWG